MMKLAVYASRLIVNVIINFGDVCFLDGRPQQQPWQHPWLMLLASYASTTRSNLAQQLLQSLQWPFSWDSKAFFCVGEVLLQYEAAVKALSLPQLLPSSLSLVLPFSFSISFQKLLLCSLILQCFVVPYNMYPYESCWKKEKNMGVVRRNTRRKTVGLCTNGASRIGIFPASHVMV